MVTLRRKLNLMSLNIASYIDHTLLSANSSRSAIKQLLQEAKDQQFAAVCVPPYYVPFAAQILGDSSIKVATVIGFPMGYESTAVKVAAIKRAIDQGANELDVVINRCALQNEEWNIVESDIDSMTTMAHLQDCEIKVIIETGSLDEAAIRKLCEICAKVGVDYVKTSTGFHGEGASLEAVKLLRECLPKQVKIKASGGIRSKAEAEAFIKAGADRIGTSSGMKMVG